MLTKSTTSDYKTCPSLYTLTPSSVTWHSLRSHMGLKRYMTKDKTVVFEDLGDSSADEPFFRYAKVWQKARIKLRGCVFLFILCLELRLYGTSSCLKDNSHKYKKNLTTLLSKLQFKRVEEEEPKIPRCMIHPNGNFKRAWNIYTVILLIYTATIMPYRIAFVETSSTGVWFIINSVIDVSFFFDILVNFNSAFENPDGSIEFNRKKIFSKYLHSWFIIDIVAVFPFEALGNAYLEEDESDSKGGYNNLFRLLKLPRLYRLMRITRILKLIRQAKESDFLEKCQDIFQLNTGLVRIISFAVTLFTVVHIVGCLWFMLAKLENFGPDTWVVRSHLIDSSEDKQYIASIYWTFTTLATVGYGDITPYTEAERLFAMMWMMVGICFNSFMISSLTTLLSSLNSTNNDLKEKLGAIEQLARETKLKPSLARKLRAAVKLNSKRSELGTLDKQAMFESLPKKLRYMIAKNMYESAADRIPFFKLRSPEFIASVIPCLKFTYYEPDKFVYKEGDDSDEIYFLYKGRVNFILNVRQIAFKSMLEGSYFGDIEVFAKIRRLCSSKTQGDCDMLVLERGNVKTLKEDFPEVGEEMKELAKKRNEKLVEAQKEVFDALKITYKSRKLAEKELKRAKQKLLHVSKTESMSL